MHTPLFCDDEQLTWLCVCKWFGVRLQSLEREREMFYLTTHSTHFIYCYMASDIWLRTILIVRKETRCRHIGYSNQLEQGFFYMHHPTDRITHTTAFVTPVVEHWLEREIAQWVHPMKDRSDDPPQHDRTLLPWSYISLPQSLEVLKSSTLTQLTREVMCVATVRFTITPPSQVNQARSTKPGQPSQVKLLQPKCVYHF